MELGLFADGGRHLLGRIGRLELAWDRHSGGRLAVRHADAGGTPAFGLRLVGDVGGHEIGTEDDPHPRLIPAESGPHRISLRAVQRLTGPSGRHCGEAMQESWAWHDGDVYLNAMMRLVHLAPGDEVRSLRAELAFGEGWRAEDDPADNVVRLRHGSGLHAGVVRVGDGADWAVPPGGVDPWERLDGQPPYYRRWGPYYDQWGGDAGWAGWEMASRDGADAVLRAEFHRGAYGEPQPMQAVRATLAVLFASSAELLAARVVAFEQPVIPRISGGRVLYHSLMDGTTVVRKEAATLALTYPSGDSDTAARVLVCGAAGRHPVGCTAGPAGLPIAISDGGASDDPNGPDLLRPDDRHGPILTDANARPDEVLVCPRLAPGESTRVELASTPGVQMAWQRWDDRSNLLLFSSAHPQGSLLSLSLRDLKARTLRIPGASSSVMARLPLYWFQANAHSPHHCLNVPDRFDLQENGPERVRFSVRSHNPARTARSDVEVTVPYLADRLRLDLVCRFEALEPWDLPGVQFCNFFPEETRDPAAWNADRVLVMAGDGQWMRIDPRAHVNDQVRAGTRFSTHHGALFVALYGGDAGNTFALTRPRRTPGVRGGYQLCGCWLDNHLYLSGEENLLPAGTVFEVDLTLVMARTSSVDSDVEAMGRKALATGELGLEA